MFSLPQPRRTDKSSENNFKSFSKLFEVAGMKHIKSSLVKENSGLLKYIHTHTYIYSVCIHDSTCRIDSTNKENV